MPSDAISRKAAHRTAKALWRAANPDKVAIYATVAAGYRAANPDKTKVWNAAYRAANAAKVKAAKAKWRAENAAKIKALSTKWRAKNREKCASYCSKRRAVKLEACPPWLADEARIAIVAVYAEAKRLTEATGVPHDVDHIVPLQGRRVRGLHVPWNLQVLPARENRSKSNRLCATGVTP